MENELMSLVECILIMSNNHYTESTYEGWKTVVSLLFYSGTVGNLPKSEMERQFAKWDFERGIERMQKILEKLPPEILGEDVKWDRVCFGYLTAEQKANLQKYYDEHKQA